MRRSNNHEPGAVGQEILTQSLQAVPIVDQPVSATLRHIPLAVRGAEAECRRGAGSDRSGVAYALSRSTGSIMMSNTTSDRSRVSASDPSEVRYFGKKHGLTDDQVRDLIKQHGNDRKTLEEAIAGVKGPTTV
jgi:hypothetical protein